MADAVAEKPAAKPAPKVKKPNYKAIFTDGIWKENPVFRMLLGLCPLLGVTSVFTDSVGFGVIFTIILILTNIIISIVGKFTPDAIRIPVYITIIASSVTIIEMLVHAFMPDLHATLGIFLPLIAVNCIIMGRAEAFASKNNVVTSILDGAGYGLGFLVAMAMLSFARELLGTGAVDFAFFTMTLFPRDFAISVMVQPTGAYIVLGIMIGIMATIALRKEDEKKEAMRIKIEEAKAKAAAKKAAAEAAKAAEAAGNPE